MLPMTWTSMGTSLIVTVVTVTGTPPSPFLAEGCEPLLVHPIDPSAASARQPARIRQIVRGGISGLGTKRRTLLSLEMALFRRLKLHCLAPQSKRAGMMGSGLITLEKVRVLQYGTSLGAQ